MNYFNLSIHIYWLELNLLLFTLIHLLLLVWLYLFWYWKGLILSLEFQIIDNIMLILLVSIYSGDWSLFFSNLDENIRQEWFLMVGNSSISFIFRVTVYKIFNISGAVGEIVVKLDIHGNILNVLFTKLIPKWLIIRLIKWNNCFKVSLFGYFKVADVVIHIYALLCFFEILFLDAIIEWILHFLFTKSKLFVLLKLLTWDRLLTTHGIDHFLFFCTLKFFNLLNCFLLDGFEWYFVENWVLKTGKSTGLYIHWNFNCFWDNWLDLHGYLYVGLMGSLDLHWNFFMSSSSWLNIHRLKNIISISLVLRAVLIFLNDLLDALSVDLFLWSK